MEKNGLIDGWRNVEMDNLIVITGLKDPFIILSFHSPFFSVHSVPSSIFCKVHSHWT